MLFWLTKLLVTPALVWIAGIVMRRWGGVVAGMLVGFPIMTAPVAYFMALEQGDAFGARSAVAILLALCGVSAYAFSYALASRRLGWLASALIATLTYFVVSLVLVGFDATPSMAGAWAFAAIFVGLVMVPRVRLEAAPPLAPKWDIWVRMAITAGLVLAITATADAMGPALSAVPATFPAITSVMTPFTHARGGREAALHILRGVLLSHVAFAMLFITVASTIGGLGVHKAYGLALLVALATSASVIAMDRGNRGV